LAGRSGGQAVNAKAKCGAHFADRVKENVARTKLFIAVTILFIAVAKLLVAGMNFLVADMNIFIPVQNRFDSGYNKVTEFIVRNYS